MGCSIIVWVIEFGKFDLNKLVQKGPEMIDAAELAVEQWMVRVMKTYVQLVLPLKFNT